MGTKSKHHIDIGVMEPFKRLVSKRSLRRVVVITLALTMPEAPCRLDLIIGDDETVKGLNRQYRGLDEVTDVLAFSDSFQGHWEGEDEPPEPCKDTFGFWQHLTGLPHLGDIVLSYPQALRQADADGSGIDKELALLIVHGILHLQGLDHLDQQSEARMLSRQQVILSSIL